MNIWLMKGYMDTIPRDIDNRRTWMGLPTGKSSQVDPASGTNLVVISILSFIGTYGEFIIARPCYPA